MMGRQRGIKEKETLDDGTILHYPPTYNVTPKFKDLVKNVVKAKEDICGRDIWGVFVNNEDGSDALHSISYNFDSR